jgi:hypothetical protein
VTAGSRRTSPTARAVLTLERVIPGFSGENPPQWRKLMLKRLIVVAMLVGCGPLQAGGTVYKWVDEQGNVEYRDVPPPPGRQFETIRRASGQPPAPDPKEVARQLQERLEATEKERDEAVRARELMDPAALRAESCRQARHNVEILEKHSVTVRTESDGKQLVLNQAQREEELVRNRRMVQEYCTAETTSTTQTPP